MRTLWMRAVSAWRFFRITRDRLAALESVAETHDKWLRAGQRLGREQNEDIARLERQIKSLDTLIRNKK